MTSPTTPSSGSISENINTIATSTKSKKEWLDNAIREKFIKTVPYSEFQRVRPAGRGGFAEIYQGYWPSGSRDVALKSLFAQPDNEQSSWDSFVRELKLVQSVNHNDNIIRFFGISSDEENQRYFLVMEFANNGNLLQYLQKNHNNLTWPDRIRMAREIASGLNCIHHENHCKNVLVHNGHMKIADYGLGKDLEDSACDSIHGGIVPYTEPKYLNDKKFQRNKPSDIYAYGVLLWHISSGYYPFSQESIKKVDLQVDIIKGKREQVISGTPGQYEDLYKRCWAPEPEDRPTIEEIMEILNSNFCEENTLKDTKLVIPNSIQSSVNTGCFHTGRSYILSKDLLCESPDIISYPGVNQNVENMENNCKMICSQYKQALKRSTTPTACSPIYHCALGDVEGLKWHLTNSPNAGQRILIATAAQYCPPSQIVPVFETLLEFGIEINSQLDDKGHTAFHWLSENIRLLESSNGRTSNSPQNETNYFNEATKWLIDRKLDINAKNIFGRTALSWLVEKQQPQAVKIMLQYKVDPNIADENGSTPLYRVLNYEYKVNNERFNKKNREVVRLLLENGAKTNIPINPEQPTSTRSFPNSLFLAIFRGWPNDILQLLIEHGASAHDTKNGQNALFYAISNRRAQATQFLMDNIGVFQSPEIIKEAMSMRESMDMSDIRNIFKKWRRNSRAESFSRHSEENID
ncbi:5696_t:CDS:2 [Ambispora leptoticha]|uniref:5696_t:CDS:1 n=1 Tax=Ambispora leptoticha TaxID=144679 RepID=A0A9N8W955_9GLOM|nr:5696_t:CDS:2 [Ambispora leptoticha]